MQTKQTKQTKRTSLSSRFRRMYYKVMVYWLMLLAVITTIAVSTVVVWCSVYLLSQAAVYLHDLLY